MPAGIGKAMICAKTLKTRLDGVILFLLLVYPVALLSVRHGMSVAFVAFVAISIWYLPWLRGQRPFDWQTGDIALAIAMGSLVVATLVSQAYHSSFKLNALDEPSRFFSAVLIYLMMRHTRIPATRALEYGFPLGALAGLATSIIFPSQIWMSGTYFIDSIHFGGAMLVLGFLSALAINWTRQDPLAVLILKVSGFGAGIYCTIHSGARGAWIALPILAILWIYYRLSGDWRARTGATGVAAAAIAGAWFIPQVRNRIEVTQSELASIFQGHFETDVGLRLQIWKAAAQVISQNPVAGVGPGGVPDALRAVHQGGGMSQLGLQVGLSEMHNEILAQTVALGMLGLLAILAIYFVPLILALKATRSGDRIKRTAAVMCIFVVIAYLIFGLTVETFNLKMIATFYAMTVAVLLGIARNTAAEATLPAAASGDAPPIRA
jgi:O-antigen ligase